MRGFRVTRFHVSRLLEIFRTNDIEP